MSWYAKIGLYGICVKLLVQVVFKMSARHIRDKVVTTVRRVEEC